MMVDGILIHTDYIQWSNSCSQVQKTFPNFEVTEKATFYTLAPSSDAEKQIYFAKVCSSESFLVQHIENVGDASCPTPLTLSNNFKVAALPPCKYISLPTLVVS